MTLSLAATHAAYRLCVAQIFMKHPSLISRKEEHLANAIGFAAQCYAPDPTDPIRRLPRTIAKEV